MLLLCLGYNEHNMCQTVLAQHYTVIFLHAMNFLCDIQRTAIFFSFKVKLFHLHQTMLNHFRRKTVEGGCCGWHTLVEGRAQSGGENLNKKQPKSTFFAAREDFLNVIYCTLVFCKYIQAPDACRKLVSQEVLATQHYSQLLNHF